VAVGGMTDPALGSYFYTYKTRVTVTTILDIGYSLYHWLHGGVPKSLFRA
jgi:hypothetical protein